MALVLNDRVKETTTTTGTGTINLGGAATGFETFVAGIGNSNTTYYCIAGQGTTEFEVGIGTVTDASPDTLSRTTILSSSNSDSAVNFSAGTKDVFCTLPASKTIREVDTALNTPTGTTAQRAGSPAAGDLRFNTTTSKFEGYSGSAWGDIGVGNFLVTNTFTGDGSDTTFTISNAVADENNLLVFIDGVFQAQNVYSISGTTLTFATAPANGRVITVYSALNNIQGANVVKATMTGDNSDTTLALGVTPISENAVQVYFDGVYQNKDSFSISGETLTFGVAPPTGVAVEAITLTVTDLAAAASSILVDEFTGDGSDTTFTLSAAPANENNTQVFVGGVYQEKATYSISGTTLTFSEAPANTVSIEVVSVAVGQINSAIQLSDADGDTKVMVEESADEDKIRFDTAGSERVIIDNAGKVGIGESTPLGNLHVKSGESSGSADANADELVIEGAGNHGVQLLGPNNSYMQLLFGDNDDSDVGYLFYNHSDNSLGFGVNAAERFRIKSDGNVGIGTSSPATLLHVESGAAASTIIRVKGTVADGYRSGFEAINGHTGGLTYSIFSTNNSDGIFGGGKFVIGNDATNSVNASTAGLLVMDSSGNVGIGTTSPSNKLDVNGAIRLMGTGTDNDSHILYFNNSACTIARDANDLELHAYNAMVFGVSNTSYPTSTERMRIDSSGNVFFGKTGHDFDATGMELFPSTGYMNITRNQGTQLYLHRMNNDGAFVEFWQTNNLEGFIQVASGTVSLQNYSDYRMKKNVSDLGSCIDRVKALRPITFEYDRHAGYTHEGFIAHEVQEVLPQAVEGEKDAVNENGEPIYQSYDKTLLIPLLTKAIQELSAKVEELEGKIE